MDDDDEGNEDLVVAEDSQGRNGDARVEQDIRRKRRRSKVVQGMREGGNSGMDMEGDLGLMKVEEASYQEEVAWKKRQGMVGCVDLRHLMMEALALALASMVSVEQIQ